MNKEQAIEFHKTARMIPENCQCNSLTYEQMEAIFGIMVSEKSKSLFDTKDIMDLPIIKIMLARVKAYKLPIAFTDHALAYIIVIGIGNPGQIITFLIDVLSYMQSEKIDNLVVNTCVISDIYPNGFYNEKTFDIIVEKCFKTGYVPFSYLY